MPADRQPSFLGGELAPFAWGRTELPQYAVGARGLRNFFVSPEGPAVSRPGTRFIVETKSSGQVRLIPFVYSDSQSYILEFGNLYVRFISNGAQVTSSGVPVEVVTPYTTAQLSRLKFAQSGDVLTITHPEHTPRELTRTSHTSWALAIISFELKAFSAPANPAIVEPLPTADATHFAREWKWKVAVLGKDLQTGLIWESAAFDVVNSRTAALPPPGVYTPLPAEIVLYIDRRIYLSWESSGLYGPTFTVVGWRVYRGRGRIFGLVGETNGPNIHLFYDYGEAPDYTRPPPMGRNPFKVETDLVGGTRTEEPACVTFFEGRRVFGGTAERPEMLWMSRTDDYSNFDERWVPTADGAVEIELASKRREEIRAILGLEKLLIFTNASVYALAGPAGEPVTADSIPEVRVQSEIGCSWLDPLWVDNTALFSRTKGRGIRALAYDNDQRSYVGFNATVLVPHLFQSSIAQWTYAEDPYGLVWAVRSDGSVLSLTYDRQQRVAAWANHSLGGSGLAESVASVPETAEDGVYFVVSRTIGGVTKRYIERLTSREIDLAKDAVCVDSAVTYSGAPTNTITGLSHLEGLTVWALANGQAVGPLTVSGGSVSLGLPDGAELVHVGLLYAPELELLELAAARTRQKRVIRVDLEVEASRGLYVGEDFDSLVEWQQREVSDDFDAIGLFTGTVQIRCSGSWGTGKAVLRQAWPLPITVMAVSREVELGR